MASNAAFNIKVEGLDKLTAAFAKSPKIVAAELEPALKKAIVVLDAASIPKMPTDSGLLRNSNKQSFSALTGTLKNTAPYAMFVHEGTKPHFPPIDAIEPWARKHGIPAFLVARAISQKGTKAHPFYKDAGKEEQARVEGFFADALKNITNKLAK